MSLGVAAIQLCDECNIADCFALKRLVQSNTQYEEWLYKEKNKEANSLANALNKSLNSYTMKDISKDYNHIKQHRYNLPSINTSCCYTSSDCIPIKRHQRDTNAKQTYHNENIKEIVMQKIFDQIHLYLYHPFTEDHNKQNQRFGTAISNENENKNEEEKIEYFEETKNKIDLEKDAYNFGQQFFYWEYYKNNHWFIKTPKYENFKQELMENDIYKIELFDWELEYKNAMDKLAENDRIKALRSNDEFKEQYNIDKNVVVTLYHLLAILFYCNTDTLQNRFSSTYRRLKNETDYEFKYRHSHYFHFGKYLRELIEVFGDILVDDQLSLYHGINQPLFFKRMIGKFYGPTSTSKNKIIAAQFAGNNGMILEFGKYERNTFYFDCFMSGYDREEEFVFIGGFAAIKIKNILQFIDDKIMNYAQHLALIQCFFYLVTNQIGNEQMIESIPKGNDILPLLIHIQSNKSSVNTNYISKLFTFRCNKLNKVTIDLTQFIKISKILNINFQCLNKESMLNIIRSTIGTKFISRYGDLICNLAYEAVMIVRESNDEIREMEDSKTKDEFAQVKHIVIDTKRFARVERIPGGQLSDSYVLDGIIVNKDVLHPKMRRYILNPRIICLDIPMEYNKGESQTNIEITKEEDFEAYLKIEEDYIEKFCRKLISLKPDVVVTEKGCSDLAQHYLMKAGITVLRRMRKTDNTRLAKCSGATIGHRVDLLTEKDIGTKCGEYCVKQIANETFSFFHKCKQPKACSIILRGGSKDVLQEMDRNLQDAMCVTRNILLNPKILPGGGATEMAVSVKLNQNANKIDGVQAYPYRAVADALEIIPRTLIQNCGKQPIKVLTELRAKHSLSDKSGKHFGVDGKNGNIVDMNKYGIWEPFVVKLQTIKTAIESASMLLRIDDVVSGIRNKDE
eukprot:277819_1